MPKPPSIHQPNKNIAFLLKNASCNIVIVKP